MYSVPDDRGVPSDPVVTDQAGKVVLFLPVIACTRSTVDDVQRRAVSSTPASSVVDRADSSSLGGADSEEDVARVDGAASRPSFLRIPSDARGSTSQVSRHGYLSNVSCTDSDDSHVRLFLVVQFSFSNFLRVAELTLGLVHKYWKHRTACL